MESPHSKKLWAVLIPAMFLPGLASLWYFVWLGDSSLAQVIYGSVKFFTLVWPIIATFLILKEKIHFKDCLLYTSPSPRDATLSRMPSSA